MFSVKLPDGSLRTFPQSIDGIALAEDISKSLAKKAVALRLNGVLVDIYTQIPNGALAEIVTADSADGVEIARHDGAHILAQAIKELYPKAQLAIGPVIENGFYYDIDNEESIAESDLPRIEERMQEIIARNLKIERFEMTRDKAIAYFKRIGENYKVEILEQIPSLEAITLYRQGDFVDPCRGPHGPSTGKMSAFKLLKVAGAYWRGDSKNKMLQRIYGTAWGSKEQLDNYLRMLEEAQLRDHRKLGKALDFFHFQDVAPGTVFWHPKGHRLFKTVENFMRATQNDRGYYEISTPEIMDRQLWVLTGHVDKFDVNMYSATVVDDEKEFTVRPMNCPGGVQVFKQGIRSYKDLPLRLAEFGKVYRYEPSGALHGLFRVRGFTQDDAHIFCTREQILEESKAVCKLVTDIYSAFGFAEVRVKFADRPESRIGSDEIWDIAEDALKTAAIQSGLDFTINQGEGAFYGPKLEFVLKDAIGRDWQLGTLQLDLNLPERLDIHYIDERGEKQRPVMLHRAILGSLERFIGILIENTAGALPVWLAPIQVVVATISERFDDYARDVLNELRNNGIFAEFDNNGDKISYKIRKHSLNKVPIIAIIGQDEVEKRTVTLRRFGSETPETLALSNFINKLKEEATPPFTKL